MSPEPPSTSARISMRGVMRARCPRHHARGGHATLILLHDALTARRVEELADQQLHVVARQREVDRNAPGVIRGIPGAVRMHVEVYAPNQERRARCPKIEQGIGEPAEDRLP